MRRAKFIDGRDIVDKLLLIKSRQEIRLLRESAKWSEVAHEILFENTHTGLPVSFVAVTSSYDALTRMLTKPGRSYFPFKIALYPPLAGFRARVADTCG